MSDRAIGIAEVEHSSLALSPQIPRRLYIPLATLLCAFLLGSWLVYEAAPLSATPPELRKESAINPELSQAEAAMARAVIEPGYASRGGREQVLFIGNSQTMAIPYAKAWDISSPQWFQVLMSRRYPGAVDVHRGSLGGLTMVEALVRIVDFGQTAEKPAAVILAIHPELINRLSMRDEVRAEAQQAAVADQMSALGETDPSLTSALHILNTLSHPAQAPSTAADATWSTRLENTLQSQIETIGLFAQREQILNLINITFRNYRNRAFHVTSASPRPLESATYLTNLDYLKAVLLYTREHGIKTFLYLGPIRSIQPNPDSAADLRRIHRDVTLLANSAGVEVLDYSNLIPESYWTLYEPVRLNQLTGDAGQPDFAHFRAEAHRRLAENLVADIDKALIAK